ncbi:DUF4169 family protein [Bartonella sp. F02]|uniref:DUF4169 family protein n=1 Tax=Bartonella sp. F02 TaxID=2967262 RepID=UPI0022A8E2DF|nr:DUF4169 family protein [Bartonella sp. F02]MCZ2328650.1 DUF4169 family protein [Bartonella sp. F02]
MKLINLRQFRKRKKRAEQTIHAEENRHRFGRTKAEKRFGKREALKSENFLDKNRLSNTE